MTKRVLGFMAHPDDVEFTCAGTLIRLKEEAGCEIAIATATSGDCGSMAHRIEEIARIRHGEAEKSAQSIGAEYYCAGSNDIFVTFDDYHIRRFVEILRKARPDIVIAPPPVDYMLDHEMTSTLVRAACFAAPIPNCYTQDPDPAPPIAGVPALYYCMPNEDKDIYGQKVEPGLVVDITDVQPRKEQMLACHASQRDWLREHHGIDEYLEMMKRGDAIHGKYIGKPAAEAFRQHLGHGYPHEDIIAKLLKIGK